jgi:hypothetical protein
VSDLGESPELDPQTRELLRRARRGFSPVDADGDRVRVRLQGAIAADPWTSSRSWALRAQGAALGLALGLGFGVWLAGSGAHVSRWYRGAPIHTPTTTGVPQGSSPVDSDRVPQKVEEASATSQPSEDEGIAKLEPRQTEPRERQEIAAQGRKLAPSDDGSSSSVAQFEIDEVAEVREVQRALAARDPAQALKLLANLDKELPKGRLLEERAAGRAVAHCMKAPSQAPVAYGLFVDQFPRSVHETRVRMACGVGSEHK